MQIYIIKTKLHILIYENVYFTREWNSRKFICRKHRNENFILINIILYWKNNHFGSKYKFFEHVVRTHK